ncbi:MAG: allantoate amidohydrolase, partial [Actinomycetes bacterium]
VDLLRGRGPVPGRPIGLVNFTDEEGARFGIACAGSRLLTGALAPDRALALRDDDGTSLAEAMGGAGQSAAHLGRDDETLRRIGTFVELHVEQGRHLVDVGESIGVASRIWPHGRWRLDLAGEANHAGTTRLSDRHDPMLTLAQAVLAARDQAAQHEALATIGRVRVEPGATNAVPSLVQAWLDARGPEEQVVRAVVDGVGRAAGAAAVEESWTPVVDFAPELRDRIAGLLGGAPVLPTGAGHDAGILSSAGVPAAMVFVRNPTGVSHSPAEHAERADCLTGVTALAAVLEELSR